MKYNIHIKAIADDSISTTMTAGTERQAERIQRGAEINLNHETHYVEIEEVEDEGEEWE